MKYVKKISWIIVIVLLCVGNSTLYADSSHDNSDRTVVENFYSQLLSNPSSKDLANNVNKVLAADWICIPTSRGGAGSAGFLKTLQNLGQVIPNIKWEPQEIFQDGNRYIVRAKATGTPVKTFLGVEPNGKSFEIMSIDIHTVENEKIVQTYHIEEWHKAIGQLKQN